MHRDVHGGRLNSNAVLAAWPAAADPQQVLLLLTFASHWSMLPLMQASCPGPLAAAGPVSYLAHTSRWVRTGGDNIITRVLGAA
jgi:hypothetical protein